MEDDQKNTKWKMTKKVKKVKMGKKWTKNKKFKMKD